MTIIDVTNVEVHRLWGIDITAHNAKIMMSVSIAILLTDTDI